MKVIAVLLSLVALVSGCVPQYESGRHIVTVDDASIGGRRQFLLYVPSGLPIGVRVPLVLSIHGYSSSPDYYGTLAAIEHNSQRYGWLAILPYGNSQQSEWGPGKCCPAGVGEECQTDPQLDKVNPCSWNAGSCCDYSSNNNIPDVEFFEHIIDWADTNMCIDTTSVFATGFSNGGFMANRLGCELSHLFAAIAPVAGNFAYGPTFSYCRPLSTVSWISFCGMSDDICNSGIRQAAETWSLANHCARHVTPSYESLTTKCHRYDCPHGIFVEWCEVEGLEHEYPGHMRPDTPEPQPATNPDATRYIFDKFSLAVGSNRAALNRTKKH
eukprot:TRINITY_DN7932_c0_g1_i1.p1 TRINITY_DN7932_c0_g1~~TRINITY_DN7932_c0_g1_i1.p1  ORF type:complete len:343 (+),score=57.28 TRINITY_DN7932_c0_g1_i1:50-1030(+)